MLRPIILLLILTSFLPQIAPVKSDNPPLPYEDIDAYEVYAAILPSDWPWREVGAKRLIISRETKGYEMCLRPEKEYEEIVGPAISDYVRLNKRPWHLQRNFQIQKPYKIITSDELNSIFERGVEGWKMFYEKYPDSGGSIELSAVGFNADKTVAVVYMGHSCGGLCGGGRFHVLQKEDGKWRLLEWKGESCSWVS